MVKLADTRDLKSLSGDRVRVRPPSAACGSSGSFVDLNDPGLFLFAPFWGSLERARGIFFEKSVNSIRCSGQRYDHAFCPAVILSGDFIGKWTICKKVQGESHFFLRHGWIYLLKLLLIPKYNHDRIRREFRWSSRRTDILCFGMEDAP